MKTSTLMLVAALAVMGLSSFAADLPLSDSYARAKAEEVKGKLSLEQKVSLLGGCATMYLKAIPEAGIYREWAMSDCSHAMKPEHSRADWPYVQGIDDKCTALAPLSALGCTWNTELAALHGHVMGEQMRGLNKDQMLGPGVNINRTPLCGRNWEYMSEDPYLVSRMVVPLIKAVQSHGVAATVKHFAVNNQEVARNTVDTLVDERTLHEIYFPAFRAAIKEAGALCLMTAYNKFNGVYCSENAYLQRGILRDRWGFMGQIVTDWGGQHSTVPAALNGGNIEMDRGKGIRYFTDYYGTGKFPLLDAVKKGDVPEATVDEMVFHLLYAMAKTGFFEKIQDKGERLTVKHQAAARTIGEEAIVLLKNEKGVLPLDKATVKKVAVVGLAADLKQAHLGCSCESHPAYEITPFAGLKKYLPTDAEVNLYPLGAEAVKAEQTTKIDNYLLETFKPNGGAAYVIRAWEQYGWKNGEDWKNGAEKLENYVEYPTGVKGRNVRYVAKVRAPETGRFQFGAKGIKSNGVSLYINDVLVSTAGSGALAGSLVLDKDEVYTFKLDVAGGDLDAKGLTFGWVLPSQQKAKENPLEKACRAADAVIVFTGTTMGYGRAKETEGGDRPDMKLPPGHDEAIAEILSWNLPKVVVINRSGAFSELPWADACATLVHMPYLGQEAGRPLARTLFGDVNPSGKLTATWPKRFEDTAVKQMGTYNNKKVIYNERFYVGYRWFDEKGIEPLFPFGYGLSYTTFAYGEPQVEVTGGGEEWKVSVPVTNTGKVDGKEIVQLYVEPVEHTVERVKKELKGFQKVALKAGETKVVTMSVTPRAFAYYDVLTHRWRTVPGTYNLLVAASAADIKGKVSVKVEKEILFDE
ncbi:MAG: glycoside hydrolase family 3 C-terminal domain-containing protein [Kiritimatiellia bacterium]